MHDQSDKPPVKGPAMLPLTRPVVAAGVGGLIVGGTSLFLAGLAAGLGLHGMVTAAAPPGPAAPVVASVRSDAAIDQMVERAPLPAPRRLVVGSLDPAPALFPEPAQEEVEVEVEVEVVKVEVAAPPAPAPVPQRKPETPVQIAALETEALELAPLAEARFAIQTGAFGQPSNADRQAAELRRLGYVPYTAGHVSGRGVALTIVYAGRYDSRESAESAARALREAGIQTHVTALAN